MPIRLVRKVTFSAGHRYWLPSIGEDENRALFGRWASPYNHGHNYVLEAGIEGDVDPETGMVVNIKDLDALLDERIVAQFDQKSLNDEVPYFLDRAASLENLLLYIRAVLSEAGEGIYDLRFTIYVGEGTEGTGDERTRGRADEGKLRQVAVDERRKAAGPLVEASAPPDSNRKSQIVNRKPPIALVSLRLEETPSLWAEWTYEDGKELMTLTRTYEFAASHRLYAPALPDARNQELYGKCANPSGHGHNYKLEVTVTGELDPRTGMMVDIESLDRAVNEQVVERYDHHNLNEDLPEFRGKVTTSEVVAKAIWDALDGKLPAKLVRVRLFETERSWFELAAPV